MIRMQKSHISVLLASLLAAANLLYGADETTSIAASTSATQSSNEEIAQLRALLAAQQKQLEALQRAIEQQQKILEKTADPTSAQPAPRPGLGNVASIKPVLPAP